MTFLMGIYRGKSEKSPRACKKTQLLLARKSRFSMMLTAKFWGRIGGVLGAKQCLGRKKGR